MKKISFILFVSIALVACSQKSTEIVEQTKPEQIVTIQLKQPVDSVLNPISTLLLVDAGLAKANGELAKAIEFYKAALKVDEQNDAAHFELSAIYRDQEEPNIKEALSHAKSALQIDPSNTWYKLYYARLLVDSGELTQGLQLFEELQSDFPHRIDYQYDLAFAYESAGMFSEAISIYDEIEATYGFDPEINFQRHNIYFAMDEIEKGIAEIEEISIQHPEYVTYSAYLANYYYEQGNTEKSLQFVHSVLGQNPADPQTNLIAAKAYASKEDKENTKLHLTNLLANEEMTLDAKISALLPFIELQKTFPAVQKEIVSTVKTLIDQYPAEAKSYAMYGDFLTHANQTQEAINAYEESLKRDQSVYMVWKQLISLYSSLDRNEEVVTNGLQMLEYYPEDFFANYITGFSNYQLGHSQLAVDLLSTALQYTENKQHQLEIYSLLGDLYHNLNNAKQSNYYYDQALLLSPDDEFILNNYSYHLAERKENLEKAFRMAKRAFELNPNDANTLDTLAWVMFQREEYEDALELFEQAYSLQDKSAIIAEHLGDAHFKTGNKEKALQYWNKALLLNSTSKLLNKKIEEEEFYPN